MVQNQKRHLTPTPPIMPLLDRIMESSVGHSKNRREGGPVKEGWSKELDMWLFWSFCPERRC